MLWKRRVKIRGLYTENQFTQCLGFNGRILAPDIGRAAGLKNIYIP